MSGLSENFIAGIAPGGLKEVYEVKILICYLLYSVEKPLSSQNISEIFSQDEAVDYFTFATALNELKSSGHLNVLTENGEEKYALTALGEETAVNLKQALPSSLREKVVKRGMKLLAKLRRDNEITAEIVPCQKGYRVNCSIHEGDLEYMNLSLYAPDQSTAEIIAGNFYENAAGVYQELLNRLVE